MQPRRPLNMEPFSERERGRERGGRRAQQEPTNLSAAMLDDAQHDGGRRMVQLKPPSTRKQEITEKPQTPDQGFTVPRLKPVGRPWVDGEEEAKGPGDGGHRMVQLQPPSTSKQLIAEKPQTSDQVFTVPRLKPVDRPWVDKEEGAKGPGDGGRRMVQLHPPSARKQVTAEKPQTPNQGFTVPRLKPVGRPWVDEKEAAKGPGDADEPTAVSDSATVQQRRALLEQRTRHPIGGANIPSNREAVGEKDRAVEASGVRVQQDNRSADQRSTRPDATEEQGRDANDGQEGKTEGTSGVPESPRNVRESQVCTSVSLHDEAADEALTFNMDGTSATDGELSLTSLMFANGLALSCIPPTSRQEQRHEGSTSQEAKLECVTQESTATPEKAELRIVSANPSDKGDDIDTLLKPYSHLRETKDPTSHQDPLTEGTSDIPARPLQLTDSLDPSLPNRKFARETVAGQSCTDLQEEADQAAKELWLDSAQDGLLSLSSVMYANNLSVAPTLGDDESHIQDLQEATPSCAEHQQDCTSPDKIEHGVSSVSTADPSAILDNVDCVDKPGGLQSPDIEESVEQPSVPETSKNRISEITRVLSHPEDTSAASLQDDVLECEVSAQKSRGSDLQSSLSNTQTENKRLQSQLESEIETRNKERETLECVLKDQRDTIDSLPFEKPQESLNTPSLSNFDSISQAVAIAEHQGNQSSSNRRTYEGQKIEDVMKKYGEICRGVRLTAATDLQNTGMAELIAIEHLCTVMQASLVMTRTCIERNQGSMQPLQQRIEKSMMEHFRKKLPVETCSSVREFLRDCVTVSLMICDTEPPLDLDINPGIPYDTRLHVPYGGSSVSPDAVVERYLWPGLGPAALGERRFRAIVVTHFGISEW